MVTASWVVLPVLSGSPRQWPAPHQAPTNTSTGPGGLLLLGLISAILFLLAGMSPGAATPEDRWLHHLRRKERATAGSVEKMATGMARSLVGRFSGRLAMT